jgi:molybdenum cofactor cytidylyltransferase
VSALPSDKENQARFAALPERMGCIVLAAGAGQRMGHRPKCLLQLNGVSLLERQLQVLSEVGGAPLVVVLGHHAARIQQEESLTRWAVRTSVNVHPDDGHVSSLRTGLQALPWPLDAVLVALADQPLISAHDVRDLLHAYVHRPEGTHMVQPSVQGLPGNPVIFSGAVAQQILACGPHIGVRQWQAMHSQAVYRWETPNDHYRTDVDNEDDRRSVETSTGQSLRWPMDLDV